MIKNSDSRDASCFEFERHPRSLLGLLSPTTAPQTPRYLVGRRWPYHDATIKMTDTGIVKNGVIREQLDPGNG